MNPETKTARPETTSPDLQEFPNLRDANVARQAEWCPEQVPDLSFRGNELAGETGEVCNVIKKLERERHGWRGTRDTKEHLAEELADVVISADLIAIAAGIDLNEAVEKKFNDTSEKVGLPHRIRRAPLAPTLSSANASLVSSEQDTKGYKGKIIRAAENMDWQQVVLNGGPPCFYLQDDGRFCGRAERWDGHFSHGIDSPTIHTFVSISSLIRALADTRETMRKEMAAMNDRWKQMHDVLGTKDLDDWDNAPFEYVKKLQDSAMQQQEQGK